jgi:hypothetical protein
MSLARFKIRIDKRARDVERRAAQIVARVALNAQRRLAVATPKKTGFAAVNWLVSTHARRNDTIPAPGASSAVSVAINQGRAALARYGSRGGTPPIFITNNVPYIEQLNNGSSAKAPAGFVQVAVASSRSTLAVVRLVK